MTVRITTSSSVVEPDYETARGFHITFRSLEESIEEVSKSMMAGSKVGFMCNTVANAQKLYQLLSIRLEDATVVLAHSRFLNVDRLHNDAALLERLGKSSGVASGKLVVVGTQVMEQSLDIDFDRLYSELAPTDYMLQRAGRLHRHDRSRPEIYSKPVLIVVEDLEEMGLSSRGSRQIYGEYRLMQADRTLRKLVGRFVSFSEIGELVQQSYDYMDDDMVEAAAAWSAQQQRREQASKTFMIASPKGKRNQPIYGWLTGASSYDSDVHGESKVRDGVSGPTVIALFQDENGEVYVPRYSKGDRKRFYLSTGDLDWFEVKQVMGSQLTLPIQYSALIYELETHAEENNAFFLNAWKKVSLLDGEIPITFNTQGECTIAGRKLCYDAIQGLTEMG